MRRIVNVYHEQSTWRRQVETMTRGGDECRAGQCPARIETDRLTLLEKIIVGISIDQRCDIADDKAFFAIRDVSKRVEEIDRLLFVFGKTEPARIVRQRARQR